MASACSSLLNLSCLESKIFSYAFIYSDYTVLLWDAEAALCLANYVGPDQHRQAVLTVVGCVFDSRQTRNLFRIFRI